MKKFVRVLGYIFVLLMLVCVVSVLVVVFSDRFNFKVTINDKTYKQDTNGLVIEADSKITVSLPDGDDFSVSIRSNLTETNNFVFYVERELYAWSDIRGIDLTDCFHITRNGMSFTISYESIAEIISETLYGYEVYVNMIPESIDDLFVMTVLSDNASVNFGFTLSEFIVSDELPFHELELDTISIIF